MKKLLIICILILAQISLFARAQTPTTIPCPLITRYLAVGSRATQVTSLKKFLASEGFLTGVSNTSYFGPSTAAALKVWQRKQGIEATGATGPKTRGALKNCRGTVTVMPLVLPAQTIKPKQTRFPDKEAPLPSIQYAWTTGGWSACMGATQSRTVACTLDAAAVADSLCASTKPTTTQSCTTPIIQQSCIFNSSTIQHGASVTAYKTATVPYEHTCSSENRTCTNGTLSGTFPSASCVVQAAAPVCNLYASQSSIVSGVSTHLVWSTIAANSVVINQNIGTVAAQGTMVISPTTTTRYTLTASGAGTSVTCTSQVEVTPPLPVCRAPRHYQFTLPTQVQLSCDANNPASVFDVDIPDRGHALARLHGTYINASTSRLYGWGHIIDVGSPIIRGGVGEDICPAVTTSPKHAIGYGVLSDALHRVKVSGYQYSQDGCSGDVSAFAGSVLDVWVEDDALACVGKDIVATSWYKKIADQTGSATSQLYTWNTWTFAPLLEMPVEKQPNRNQIMLLSSSEASPDQSPTRLCGQESATVHGSHVINGSLVSTESALITPSGGGGHAVLQDESVHPLAGYSGILHIRYDVLANYGGTTTTSGGCCGDAVLGAVQY
jgi:Putative peptidoglycan binding domain